MFEKPVWHHLNEEKVLTILGGDVHGLSEQDAKKRLEQYGHNQLSQSKGSTFWQRLFHQFNNALILVMLAAAIITALLGHWVDFYVILLVVVVNTVVGYLQEGKAERALHAIKHMLAPSATVLRDGQRIQIAANVLVPGDIIFLAAGDKVPADVRLLQVKNFQVQEAVLTGESVAVEKQATPQNLVTDLAERACMAYSGTLVSSGHAKAIVVDTGEHTEIGRISSLMSEIETLTTPLLQQMSRLSRWISTIIIGFAVLVYVIGTLWLGVSTKDMFMIVLGFTVAAIPEGLPAILTITLAIGVQRMAARKAIIRRLPVVETLGAVSVICSDKTGTLTRNEMMVTAIATCDANIQVSGVGYSPEGILLSNQQPINLEQQQTIAWLLKSAALCNDASLYPENEQWKFSGDPMEVALLTVAHKAEFTSTQLNQDYARIDVIPFDAEHRFMSTLHQADNENNYILLKGAPEKLVADCQWQQLQDGSLEPVSPAFWQDKLTELAASGQRVLAFAMKKVDKTQTTLDFTDLQQDLVLLGLTGLIDPPRQEAIEAIAACREASIDVKMITGDHATTASAIAGKLALKHPEQVLTGADLNALDDIELREKVKTVSVFARTSPEHKLRLVTALQQNGQLVAMTGDGVNDAPALKRSDVGIAMGRSGTEAAKEASEMVLADDNFASIVQAIREGRTVYDNLKKAILFMLPINGGESLSIIIAVLAGLTFPIMPLQILWVNMVSSVALAFALAFEPTEEGVMKRRPRDRNEKMISGLLLWRISFVSVLFLSGIFGIFMWSQAQGASIEASRTYAVNTLVMMEVFYLFNVRCLNVASWSIRQWFTSKTAFISLGLVILLQGAFTYLPVMQALFNTEAIPFSYWLVIFGIGVLFYLILEVEKSIHRMLRTN